MTVSATNHKVWTILSLLEWGTKFLNDKGFDDSRLNVELLLCHLLRCKRIDLYLKFDQILNEDELANFRILFQRRLAHEPLQYIIGETEFMGLKFKVDRRVFIPRSETEVLVEEVIKYVGNKKNQQRRILDLGTGSGNIPISIAKYLDKSVIDSIDISSDAIDVARFNIQHHQLSNRITLIINDILNAEQDNFNSQYDIIVSNPPYISEAEYGTLQPEVKDYEPAVANTDHADGLTFYSKIASLGKELLNIDGAIFVEIGYDQSNSVPNIFYETGYQSVELIEDYRSVKRVVKVKGR
jgi:release factor glutamine methyltransferase